MIRCYIIDDEEASLSLLSKFINKTPALQLEGSSLNPLNALQKFQQNEINPDITFLDINMPEISGLELANLIGQYTHIVFTTAHTQYGMEAFDRDAIDYIAKPFGYERFLKAISRYQKLHQSNQVSHKKENYFFIRNDTKGKLTRVLIDEILYIESTANFITIHTSTEKHTTYLTLTEAEAHLAAHDFVRVHKSIIVNPKNIKSVEGSKILLHNDATITAGTSYRKALTGTINQSLLISKRRS
ncbi:LytTR family DNA-binding domain-containing protein [Olivibacter sp. CPCC 100613]|uniref:LytR/AlgR family response regulator transcription factor n=1 Tax=Olivibacter sp. CPCC 100613 TaxID=3079931 RepID=UPI002FFB2897